MASSNCIALARSICYNSREVGVFCNLASVLNSTASKGSKQPGLRSQVNLERERRNKTFEFRRLKTGWGEAGRKCEARAEKGNRKVKQNSECRQLG